MLQTVDVAPVRLGDYRDVIAFDELRALAAPLRGARVLQINATAYGGGVSALLRSLVPLERDLGPSPTGRSSAATTRSSR